jgi:hypothetical protein
VRYGEEVAAMAKRGVLPVQAIVLLLFGVFLSGCPQSDDEQVSAGGAVMPGGGSEINELLKDTVVLIETELHFPDGSIDGTGSGFVINNKGRVITNAHVVAPEFTDDDGNRHLATGRTVKVVFHPGTDLEETLQAEVVRENEDLDLALLKVSKETPRFLDLADSSTVQELTRIICAGHPAGLREISLRTGAITAHRTFEGKKWLEHDAEAEWGNSGGPVVSEEGKVLGVMARFHWNRILASKWAVPANTLRDWLASDPANDPPVYLASADGGPVQVTEGQRPPTGAKTQLEELLDASGLSYSYAENGSWQLEYDNQATVYVQEFDDILRAYVIYGDLPTGGAVPALAFSWHDPVGRFSVTQEGDVDKLYWEAQVPMGVVTPEYLRDLCDIGASQVENFMVYLSTEKQLETPTDLYPGGDPDEHFAQLTQMLKASGLIHEKFDEETFKIPFDNDVDVYVKVFNGMAYVHAYCGGFPGEDEQEMGELAVELLRYNWNDPLGRIAIDDELDVVWECQVPMTYLTADYLGVVAAIGSNRVEEYRGIFGDIPFNSERFAS